MTCSVHCWYVRFIKPPAIKTVAILFVNDLMDRIKILSKLFLVTLYIYIYINILYIYKVTLSLDEDFLRSTLP